MNLASACDFTQIKFSFYFTEFIGKFPPSLRLGSLFFSSSEMLPQDILIDILLQMPVKTLLRLRATNKWFDSLITSGEFAHLHVNHSSRQHNFLGVLLPLSHKQLPSKLSVGNKKRKGKQNACSENFLIDKDVSYVEDDRDKLVLFKEIMDGSIALELKSSNFTTENHILRLNQGSFDSRPPGVQILNFCGGLICLRLPDHIVVWNPSVNFYKVIAPENGEVPFDDLCVALSYDPANEHYMLVGISWYALRARAINVKLYSLKTGSWWNSSLPYGDEYECRYAISDGRGIYAQKRVHWVAYNKIICFNASERSLEILNTPSRLLPSLDLFPLVYGDNFGLIDEFGLWVLKEYRGKETTWIRMLTLPHLDSPQRFLPFTCTKEIVVPTQLGLCIYYEDNGLRPANLVRGDGTSQDMLVYATHQLMQCCNRHKCACFYGAPFVESLISPIQVIEEQPHGEVQLCKLK